MSDLQVEVGCCLMSECPHYYRCLDCTTMDNCNFTINYRCEWCDERVIAIGFMDFEQFEYICKKPYDLRNNYDWFPTFMRNGYDFECMDGCVGGCVDGCEHGNISQQVIANSGGEISYIILTDVKGDLDHMGNSKYSLHGECGNNAK